MILCKRFVFKAGEVIVKKIMGLICCVLFAFLSAVSAEGLEGIKTTIRIEGYDRTLFSDEVYAYTFADALKVLSNNGFIDIQVNASEAEFSVYSVNGVENGFFGGEDKWFCYIERDGRIIKDNIMNIALKNGDGLVVYYGDLLKTQVISDFRHELNNGEVKFFTGAQNNIWTQEDGKWIINDSIVPVSGVRINLKMPGGNYKILRTGSDGYTKTALGATGVYMYKAEKYNFGGVPFIAASDRYYMVHGIKDAEGITRGEAAAFIVNNFGIKKANTEEFFEDVFPEDANYKEIMAAYAAGIIAGRGNGIFAPEEKVDLKSFCIMIYKARKIEPERITVYKDVPQWALAGINSAVQSGALDNISPEWNSSVTEDMLITIYKNLNLKDLYPIRTKELIR